MKDLSNIKPSDAVYLNRFTPRGYQIPILDAIENKGYKRVLGIMPRRCLSGKTHIIMSDGSWKELRDIQKDDAILSWDGTTFVEDRVKHVWSTGVKKTNYVRAGSYLPIISSDNHQFATTTSSGDMVTWKELKDIGLNRSILQYAGLSGGKDSSRDKAEFFGYMLSDGYVNGYQQPKFTNNNRTILTRVEQLAIDLFDVNVIWRSKGNGFDLGFSNKTLGGGNTPNPIKDLFRQEDAAVPKSKRRIPRFIWNLTRESLLRFFAGIISGDGNIYCHSSGFTAKDTGNSIPPSVEITLNCGMNYYYAWDMYWLLRKIGIIPQVPYKEKGSNWKIKVAKNSAVKLLLGNGPIYGKEEAQQKALTIVSAYTKKILKVKGCFRSKVKVKPDDKEELFDLETTLHHNFIANGYLVHNSGKDITAFNLCIRACLRKPCVIYYIFPTYSQGKKVIWDSVTNDGQRFLDFIPPQLVESMNSQEMKIRFINGSLLQIVGSDRFDALRGTNPAGAVFSEYAYQDPRAYPTLRPILTANDGWALFISTPQGKNHLWTLYNIAQHSDDWFCYKLTVDDTQHISLFEIEKEKAEGLMSEDLIQQEYYTSFTMGVEGAYYAKYIQSMRVNCRLGDVPWESSFKVHTAWDIGVRDSTTIIFFQTIGQTVRLIDCYENSKEGLEHYVSILESKPYSYGKHFAPHDIAVREWGSGLTRIEKARQLGVSFATAPNISIEDGIEAVRSSFSKIWIDDKNCLPLLKALENYRQEYDAKRKVYKTRPLHDFSSHFADCMRYLCLSLPKTRDGLSPEKLQKMRQEALYGHESNMPSIFRDKY